MTTDAHEQLVRGALEGLQFPARQYEVVTYATDRGGVEPAVLDALVALPSRAFTSAEDVIVSLPDHT
jgi:hypothetical protein